jgi:hypothetical protein
MLNLKTSKAVLEQAKKLWLESNPKPKPKLHKVNYDPVTVIGLLLMVVTVLFSGSKAMLALVPVAESMYSHLAHGSIYIFLPSKELFVFLFSLLGAIMSEFGLIYFMLLSNEVIKLYPDRWYKWLDIRVWSTWLPSLVVYGILVFLVIISMDGEGNPLFKFLPIPVGAGLSLFAEGFIVELVRVSRENKNIREKLDAEYKIRLEHMRKDPQYNEILARVISEALPNVTVYNPVKKVTTKPYADLESMDLDKRNSIILDTYKGLIGNYTLASDFIKEFNSVSMQADAVKLLNSDTARVVEGKRLPPNGLTWKLEEIIADLEAINAPKTVNTEIMTSLGYGGSGWQRSLSQINELRSSI